MEMRFYHWITQKFPQNYLIKYPFRGAIIIALYTFLFTILYEPLHFHGTARYPYFQLLGFYCISEGVSVYLVASLLPLIPWFGRVKEWTFMKEVLAITIILIGIGIDIFLLTFVVQPEMAKWTFSELLNELVVAFLLGSFPFIFSLVINASRQHHHSAEKTADNGPRQEAMLQIDSKLKKETLSFHPGHFLYAESDGNYVVFYLNEESEIRKRTIRNSISQVEQQLTGQPHFFRTHRSFIVNLDKVTGKTGNTSGYRLNLEGLSTEIPVSRQNVAKFDELFLLKG